MQIICSICHADSINESVTMFRVPDDDATRRIWSKMCGFDMVKSSHVCHKHFQPDDFLNGPPGNKNCRLRCGSLPKLFCSTQSKYSCSNASGSTQEYQHLDAMGSKWNNAINNQLGSFQIDPLAIEDVEKCIKFEVVEIAERGCEKKLNATEDENAKLSFDIHSGANEDKICSSQVRRAEEIYNERGLSCEYCNADFTCNYTLQQHSGTCKYRVKRNSSLGSDTDVKIDLPPGKNISLERPFASIRKRSPEPPISFVCKQCNREFKRESWLEEHQRIHTGEKPYTCSECGKSFRLKRVLSEHQKRHSNEKTVQCSDCPKRYATRSDLTKHWTAIHRGTKPHSCEVCGSSFSRPDALRIHKLIHSNERPYQCDQCSMAFAHSRKLKIHQHTHSGEKPYSCHLCVKAFSRKCDLNRHILTHTRNKPYKCTDCEKAFASTSGMANHLRSHRGDKIHNCDECSESFKYQKELRDHQAVHYQQKIDGTKITRSSEDGAIILEKDTELGKYN